jgi:acyl-CoA thioesterase-1
VRRRPVAAAVVTALAATLIVTASTAGASGVEGTWCVDRSHLAIIGASSETGYGTTGYTANNEEYVPTHYGWTRRVMHNLNVEWDTHGTNYAHNGATVADYLSGGRWDITTSATADIAIRQPDLVIINLGGNEYAHNTAAPAEFEADLRALVTDIREAREAVDILFLVYPTFTYDTAAYPWTDYAAVIGDVAASQGAAMMDLRQHIDSATRDTAGLWYQDDVHLNDAGQSVVSAAVWGWLAASC